MPRLDGQILSRRDLMARVGRVEQIGGVRRVRIAEGPGDGVELAEFRTGTGFDFAVALSRGMDIPEASWRGQSLCWHGAPGMAAPQAYDPEGLEWLRVFFGGLLATCGLSYAGAPGKDGTASLGLHGRYTSLVAEGTSVEGRWEGDDYVMTARGRMREAKVFFEKLVLTRTVTAKLGEPRLCIEDVVENEGHAPAEHMIVYHCNFGYPLLSDQTRIFAPSRERKPVAPGMPMEDWDRFLPPTAGFKEWVYYHTMDPAADGTVTARLENAKSGMKAYLKYDAKTLPKFVQWKMCGQGEYVLGLEPANCGVEGRAKERERGTLQVLQPGESRRYRLEFGIANAE
jgi:hypothetical protein